jgi:hypothetical protein
MSAYEGSKMQENDQDKKHVFLGHIKEAQQSKKELDRLIDLEQKGLETMWHKAQILSIEELKGWMKGEGYSLVRRID